MCIRDSTGSAGYDGSQGVAGPQGPQGPSGPQGFRGFTGSASTQVGFTGSQGVAGTATFRGFTGSVGFAGSRGANTGPAFSAYANNNQQTITSGSQQRVLFQVEEFDTDNCFANSRFTPNLAGYYQLNAEVRIDGPSGTGETMLVLWKNGSEYKRGNNSSGAEQGTNFYSMVVSSMVFANGTTDFFEIYIQQTSGSNKNITAVNGINITWFNGCMLRTS